VGDRQRTGAGRVTFAAFQSITGTWFVSVSWPRCRYRYGGTSLLPTPMPDEATAIAVADHMAGCV
jgi:hypothetical protein